MKPLAILAALAIAAAASEPTPQEKGLAIATETERRDDGFGDYTARIEMVLSNKHGKESRREMQLKVLEQANDGDKSLTIFDAPPDVNGTALLSFSHRTGDDDQWLYLPALKRVKRIASNNQAGPFMGSEFAYEDLSSQEVEKFTYKFLREEDLDGVKCFVIERYPVHPKSGYTRQVVWIDQEHYRTRKIDYYDRKDALLKTLQSSDFELFLGKFWRPKRMIMTNHQSGKATELTWRDFQFQTGLTDRDFDTNALSRVR